VLRCAGDRRAYACRVPVLVSDRVHASAPTAQRTRRGRFLRYAAGSVAAVLVSALAFAVAYRLLELGPRVASVTAFLAGALVNFSASRFWAWDRRRRFGLGRDVVGYALLAVAIAVVATGVTSLADAQLAGTDPDRRAVLVEATYFATYAVLFLVRFVLLDRVVFRSRHHVPSTTRAYRAP
jgi:putative flippase GtrA